MNRIILIGNGFDLAHGLKTSYKNFIVDYWKQLIKNIDSPDLNFDQDPFFSSEEFHIVQDKLWNTFAPILSENPGDSVTDELIDKHILQKANIIYIPSVLLYILTHDIYKKGWTDIENIYYELIKFKAFADKHNPFSQKIKTNLDFGGRNFLDSSEKLNSQMDYLKIQLAQYLDKTVQGAIPNSEIQKLMFEPIRMREVSIRHLRAYYDHIENIINAAPADLRFHWHKFGVQSNSMDYTIRAYKNYQKEKVDLSTEELARTTDPLAIPQKILLLSFNYTPVTDMYVDENNPFVTVNHIHGITDKPETMIFGYGDELDPNFNVIRDLNDNEYLRNFKSFKYLETGNYRNLLSFMEEAPFQISIMGHSCGNSDRTLLNTMFEHQNCISIKPFFYRNSKGKDNYLDLIQNISRSFTDMQLMRDSIVNYTFCSPLPQSGK